MERKPVEICSDEFPLSLRALLEGAAVYDSSCSDGARVYFVDKDEGFYIKTAEKGKLNREAELTRFFASRKMAAEVIAYESLEKDWLITARVPGEDCTFYKYLEQPKKLCDTTANLLRLLHETDSAGCPVIDRTAEYMDTVKRNYKTKKYDLGIFCGEWSFSSADEAFAEVQNNGKYLKADTLLHGDYCLPNIMLNDWEFSGFVDLDSGGIGDRHIDLFWGIWTLWFNLDTDRYKDRFLDAYGRDKIEVELLRTVAAAEIFG